MERKLLRKIVMCFVISGTFLISIFSLLIYRHENRGQSRTADIVFDQFEAVYMEEAAPEHIMDRVSTMDDQLLLIVAPDSRRIWGGSRAGYAGLLLEESVIEKLRGAEERKPAVLFGKRAFVKSREFEDLLLVSVQGFDENMRRIALPALGCALMLFFIFLMLVIVIRHYFRDYIFSEFEMIEQTIRNALKGKEDTLFYTEQDTEIHSLVESLNKFMKRDMELRRQIQKSNMDVVTGLTNRSGFEKYITEFRKRDGRHGVMMMIDVDNFKSVNDNLGHLEGDRVLKIVADNLKSVFREQDTIVRLGGDEFVVFLESDIPADRLEEKAEKLIQRMHETLPDHYQAYKVSISIGIAVFTEGLEDFDRLYRCADEALYEAKRNGKNQYRIRICTAEEPEGKGKTGKGTEDEKKNFNR